MLTNLRFRFVGFSRFLFVVFLIVYTTKWQKTFDEIEQSLLEARFLANETLNTYVLQQIGPTEWKRSRSTFFRLCPSVSNCELVPPFIHYESRQMIAPSYGVATCVIYKNMSTILTAIMCYLYDALTYRRQVKDLTHDTYNVRFCKGKNEFNSIRSLASFRNSTTGMKLTWLNILVSRNPLERFISGFINKCIREKNRTNVCYECGDDIKCVMERQYERLMSSSQLPSLYHTVEDAHFAPQTWHCELRHNLHRYKLIKYSGSNTVGMLNELEMELEKRGIPHDILQDIRSQILRKRTSHKTYDTLERVFYEKQVQSSPYLMKLLVKMFYYDYLVFGYPLPEII